MIAANEAVGRFFRARSLPSVWRVHAPPDPDRVTQLGELLGAYGIRVDADLAATPVGMKQVLDQINEKPGAQALSFLVLRTLTQAVWDTVPIGHFGLASGDYLHFTSPIRRYPDLLVHRLLKYHLHRDGHPSGGGYAKPPPPVETLTELAHASSTHERRAMEAEREAVAMYRAYLMRDQVGQRFEGTVSAVTSFGAFVELDEPYVEGLIKLESLGDDQFDFDDVHMRLAGRKTGLAIELGDRVTVEINNVSVVRRRIDFTLVATQAQRKAPRAGRKQAAGVPAGPAARPRDDAPGARPALAQRRKAARETERAVRAHVERGAAPRKTREGGKLRLGVSHRAMHEREADSGGGRRAKPTKKR
jgi:ribonuclease R